MDGLIQFLGEIKSPSHQDNYFRSLVHYLIMQKSIYRSSYKCHKQFVTWSHKNKKKFRDLTKIAPVDETPNSLLLYIILFVFLILYLIIFASSY